MAVFPLCPSYRHVEEMMAKRGVYLTYETVRMTYISHHTARMESRTARRPGSGLSRSMMLCTCAVTTDESLAGIRRQKAGQIIAAGVTHEVLFEAVEKSINDRIDDAYRTKYKGSPYLNPMIGARARAATVRITPRAFHR